MNRQQFRKLDWKGKIDVLKGFKDPRVLQSLANTLAASWNTCAAAQCILSVEPKAKQINLNEQYFGLSQSLKEPFQSHGERFYSEIQLQQFDKAQKTLDTICEIITDNKENVREYINNMTQ